jgi:hypothetical protein
MENFQRCPNCGFRIEPGDKFCRNCGKPFEERHEETPPPPPPLTPPTPPTAPESQGPPPPAEEPKYVAWEDREHVGFFAAIWKTWVESVFNPDKFFSRLPYNKGLGSPILYALIILWITEIIDSVYRLVFSNFWLTFLRDYLSKYNQFYDFGFGVSVSVLSFFIRILIAPFVIIIALFIVSGIYHVICMLFGWGKRDFEATLRAISYSVGPGIFSIVPFCGSPIGWIWALVLSIIGLKHMQQTSSGKATFVILIPIILCCCLTIILALVFGAAIVGFLGKATKGGYNF